MKNLLTWNNFHVKGWWGNAYKPESSFWRPCPFRNQVKNRRECPAGFLTFLPSCQCNSTFCTAITWFLLQADFNCPARDFLSNSNNICNVRKHLIKANADEDDPVLTLNVESWRRTKFRQRKGNRQNMNRYKSAFEWLLNSNLKLTFYCSNVAVKIIREKNVKNVGFVYLQMRLKNWDDPHSAAPADSYEVSWYFCFNLPLKLTNNW